MELVVSQESQWLPYRLNPLDHLLSDTISSLAMIRAVAFPQVARLGDFWALRWCSLKRCKMFFLCGKNSFRSVSCAGPSSNWWNPLVFWRGRFLKVLQQRKSQELVLKVLFRNTGGMFIVISLDRLDTLKSPLEMLFQTKTEWSHRSLPSLWLLLVRERGIGVMYSSLIFVRNRI